MTDERQFGPYRLVRQIAVGGMAELYLAKTHGIAGFEKYVALKMIHPNFSQDDNFIEMLIDEAKISVQLQHVNIAQTFDLGRVGDTYYITMEYVDGADLYKLLRRASEKDIEIPVDIAAYIAKEVANGLDYAHRRRDVQGEPLGIVHRDVSPQNVLISHSGEVKLVDFGIAKATMKARQTAVGVIKGKYYYMSPEQAWGDPVDHRTDIFSTGILLYEALTGQMLYLEDDLHRLLDMVRKARIASPTALRRGIPPQLERIVMNTLKKEREQRYRTAGDLASDLERFMHVYSPVFTAAKLSEFFHEVLDDEPPPPVVQVQKPRPSVASMVTQRLEEEDLLRERSEFADENSVIFRVSEMDRKAREAEGGPPAPAPAPARTPPGPPPRRSPAPPSVPVPMATHISLIGDLGNIEEQTVITGPPGFSARAPTRRDADSDYPGADEFEPTLVGSAFSAGPDEGPGQDDSLAFDDTEEARTFTRDPKRVQDALRQIQAKPPAPPIPAARPASPPARPPAPAKRKPAHPALSASTPQPAVSELRGPRQSRKTPAQPVPAVGAPSLLASLVGQTDAGPPVRRTPPAAASPAEPQAPAPQQNLQPGPLAGSPQVPSGQGPAGQGAPPVHFGPDGLPVTMPPSAAGAGNAAPGFGQQGGFPPAWGQASDPFAALPTGSPPLTLTKQLQALELEEIPDAYKLGRKKPRWLLPAVLGGVCVALGVVIGVVAFTGAGQTVETALVIDSKPTGARITINGEALAQPTPMRWPEAKPSTLYKLEFELDGYKPYSKDVMLDSRGGDIQVTVVLLPAPKLVTLVVESTPPRAEIFLNGVSMGHSPKRIPGLDPKQAIELELRHHGYKTHHETLQWNEVTQLERKITLQK
jgi:eukaryotic-like serine/threonine-protein kinase